MELPVEANKKYIIRGRIRGTGAIGGSKFAVTLPAGATMYIQFMSRGASNTSIEHSGVNVSGTLSASINRLSSLAGMVYFDGTFTIGSTPGSVQLQMACTTAGQTTTACADGSYMEIIPLQ